MEIIRENGHDYLLCENEVTVYFQGNEVAKGKGKLDLGCYDTIQPIFEVNGHPISRRHIPECGVTNLRDMGGVPTENGKHIAYHHFYRGAALLPRQDEHKMYLNQLGLKMIVDFRSEVEVEGHEDYVPEGCEYSRYSGLKMMDNPQNQGNFDFSYLVQTGNIYQLKQYMVDMYETMAIDNPAFKALIDDVKEGKTPLYFHCTAGKDRTGVGGALILFCLGVSEEEVYKEYMLSNVYRKEINEWLLDKVDQNYREETKPLYYVQEDYLKKTLDEIKRIYGTMDAYFEKEHSLTKEMRLAMQEKYCD